MSWNYRVVHRVYDTEEHEYAIREVYYDDEGNPNGVTADTVSPYGETLAELGECLMEFVRATDKPVLEWAELTKEAAAPADAAAPPEPTHPVESPAPEQP